MVLVPSPAVSADATFTAMKVATQVPGTNGRSTAANVNFPLVVDMPASATCTGTVGTTKNVCLVKRENPVGPFVRSCRERCQLGRRRVVEGLFCQI